MRLLVLGGTHHVGRAFVEAAVARGDEVTTVTRGLTGTAVAGAEARHADRLDRKGMRTGDCCIAHRHGDRIYPGFGVDFLGQATI